MVTTGSKKKSAERENVQSKLDLATALSHLGQANYEKAAYHLLRIGPAKELGDWVGKVSDLKARIQVFNQPLRSLPLETLLSTELFVHYQVSPGPH